MLKRKENPVRNTKALLHWLRRHKTQGIRKHSEPPQSGHVHYYNFPSSPLAISDYDTGELPVQYVNGPLRADTWTVPTAVTSRSPLIIKHTDVQLKLYILNPDTWWGIQFVMVLSGQSRIYGF
jgi:hypothetical protein